VTERLEGARFRRSPTGAAALTVVALGLGAWGVINSPVFGIDRILVEGNRALDADEVRRLAGVRPGTNLLRLSTDTVARSVERSPWIADATAARSLPTALVIGVEERRPAGWVKDPGGPVVVASDGVVLERATEPPDHLPSLGTASASLEPGGRLPERPVTLRVASSLSPGLLARVRSVASEGDALVLELRSGARIEYGGADGLTEKNRTIEELLSWAEERGVAIASIDVRVAGAPALLPQRTP
jgi:cell division protein FtsQ